MLAPIDGTNKGGVGSLQSLKMKHPHLQVVLSVGGSAVPGEIFANVARDPLQRDMFANTAGQLIETTGLDGIDGGSSRDTVESARVCMQA